MCEQAMEHSYIRSNLFFKNTLTSRQKTHTSYSNHQHLNTLWEVTISYMCTVFSRIVVSFIPATIASVVWIPITVKWLVYAMDCYAFFLVLVIWRTKKKGQQSIAWTNYFTVIGIQTTTTIVTRINDTKILEETMHMYGIETTHKDRRWECSMTRSHIWIARCFSRKGEIRLQWWDLLEKLFHRQWWILLFGVTLWAHIPPILAHLQESYNIVLRTCRNYNVRIFTFWLQLIWVHWVCAIYFNVTATNYIVIVAPNEFVCFNFNVTVVLW